MSLLKKMLKMTPLLNDPLKKTPCNKVPHGPTQEFDEPPDREGRTQRNAFKLKTTLRRCRAPSKSMLKKKRWTPRIKGQTLRAVCENAEKYVEGTDAKLWEFCLKRRIGGVYCTQEKNWLILSFVCIYFLPINTISMQCDICRL